jgi:hypothetical protein
MSTTVNRAGRRALFPGWRLAPALALGLASLLSPTHMAVVHADSTCMTSGEQVQCTFSSTGAAQTWVVPAGVTSATFDVAGGQGGQACLTSAAAIGGLGGQAKATLAVTAGEVMQIRVGSQGGNGSCTWHPGNQQVQGGGPGGWNGGGRGGGIDPTVVNNTHWELPGGGGGGASDVSRQVNGQWTSALVAGGGGGGGGSGFNQSSGTDIVGGNGGPGGGASGGNGLDVNGYGTAGSVGRGASAISGGSGGISGFGCREPEPHGTAGTAGLGGTGNGQLSGMQCGGAGGGGGGSYLCGGGGGAGIIQPGLIGPGAGGGGGSGFGPAGVVFDDGVQSGNGRIVITYWGSSSPVAASPTSTPVAPPVATPTPTPTPTAASSATAPRPDLAGARIQQSGAPALYLVDVDGTLHHVPDPTTYNNLFRDWNGIQQLSNISGITVGQELSSGAHLAIAQETLVKVYLIDNNSKRWVTSQAVMDKFYFNWNQIQKVPQSTLDALHDGPPLT